MTLEELHARGFDRSTDEDGVLWLACSQCDATCINGVPCHETGCLNKADWRDNDGP